MIAIGGYYDTGISIGEEIEELRGLGLAGLKFKVGGRSPTEDARRASGRPATRPVPTSSSRRTRTRRWAPEEAIRFARLVHDCDLAWFEEPCRWANDRRAMRDVRFGAPVARVCAGQSELSAAGCRDLMAEGGDRHLQLRRVLVGRADRVAPGRRHRARRSTSPWATTRSPRSRRTCSPRSRTGRSCECFHPDRDPIWWNLVANRPPLVGGMLELTDAPGLGWELDGEYMEAHRLDAS